MNELIKISDNVYIVNVNVLGLSEWLATHVIIGSNGLLVIDPGPNLCVDSLVNTLIKYFNVEDIKGIALTHIHLDHGGGTGLLIKKLGSVNVYVHPRGVRHLSNPERLWEASKEVLGDLALTLGRPEPVDQGIIIGLDDGSVVDLGGTVIKAIHTPGHAPHHIAYLVEPDNVLIAGDALGNMFNRRIYPVTVPPFNLVDYLRSLNRLSRGSYRYVSVAHFGYVENDCDIFIQRFKDKIISWSIAIASFIKEGIKDPRDIYDELLQSDQELSYMFKFREVHKLVKGASYRAVLGVYQYIDRLLNVEGASIDDLLKMMFSIGNAPTK